jgi:hypothetical protein
MGRPILEKYIPTQNLRKCWAHTFPGWSFEDWCQRISPKYCNAVGELKSGFILPKLCSTCVSNICSLLRALIHSYEATNRCFTNTMRNHNCLISDYCWDHSSTELTGLQNQIDLNHKIKQIPWYRIEPGAFAPIFRTSRTVLVLSFLLIR